MCKPAKKQLLVDIMFHMSVMHSSGRLRVPPLSPPHNSVLSTPYQTIPQCLSTGQTRIDPASDRPLWCWGARLQYSVACPFGGLWACRQLRWAHHWLSSVHASIHACPISASLGDRSRSKSWEPLDIDSYAMMACISGELCQQTHK